MSGKLVMILGCVCAGKTTEMKRRLRLQAIAKRKCVCVKYVNDTRYTDKSMILTHDEGQDSKRHADTNGVPVLVCAKLGEIEDQLAKYDVIGVDEVQFMVDAPTVLDRLAQQGKTIIMSGLNATYERKPFPVVSELVARAEEVVLLSAICVVCCEPAHFSKKISNLDHTGVEDLGGLSKYEPRCRICFHKA